MGKKKCKVDRQKEWLIENVFDIWMDMDMTDDIWTAKTSTCYNV